MDFLNGKKILIYGPCNKNIESYIKNFKKYDYILLNNNMLELIIPYLDNIKNRTYKFIRILNGIYTEKMYKLIESRDNLVDHYFVSEVHTKNYLLEKTTIQNSKILPLNNNYKNYGFVKGYPQMIPKTLLALDYYNSNFSFLKISGVTFYMDIGNNSYNLDYCVNSVAKKLWDMSESTSEEILRKKYAKRINTVYEDKVGGHYYKEGYNFFLKFLFKYKDKIKLDSTLKKIVKENPTLFKI